MSITGPVVLSANDFMENTGLDKILVLNNEPFGRTCFCPNPLGEEVKRRERLCTALAGTSPSKKTVHLVESRGVLGRVPTGVKRHHDHGHDREPLAGLQFQGFSPLLS